MTDRVIPKDDLMRLRRGVLEAALIKQYIKELELKTTPELYHEYGDKDVGALGGLNLYSSEWKTIKEYYDK